MTITWMDGFDIYNNNSQMAPRGYVQSNVDYVTGRLGVGQAVEFGNSVLSFPLNGGSTAAAMSMGFAFKTNSITAYRIFEARQTSSGDPMFNLNLTGTGALAAFRDNTQLGVSASGLITANAWNYIEVEVTRNSSTGTFKVYVNGVKVLDLSAQNTGSADPDLIYFHPTSQTFDLDDLYATNVATKLGECRIDVLYPSADTAQKDWTPSTGSSNYAMVDETTIGTTDYVSGDTAGDKDLYALTDLGFNPLAIYAVNVLAYAKKDDVSTRTYRSNIKSSSTTANGATRGLATSFALYSDIFALDPNGSIAWTQSSVNAMQAGPEVVA